MSAGRVRGYDQLLHGVFHGNHRAGDQFRAVLRDIRVNLPGKVHIDLLCRVMDIRLGCQLRPLQRLQGGFSRPGVPVHECSVFRGSLQHGFRGVCGIFSHG